MSKYKKKQIKVYEIDTKYFDVPIARGKTTVKVVLKEEIHNLFVGFLKLWSKEVVDFKEIEKLGKKFGLDVKYHKPTKIKARWEIKELKKKKN